MIYAKVNGIQMNFATKEKLQRYVKKDMRGNLKSLEIELNGHIQSTLYSICWLFNLSELEEIRRKYKMERDDEYDNA